MGKTADLTVQKTIIDTLHEEENLWDIVERKLRNIRPKNTDELKAAIKATRASVTPKQCHKLITSMPLHTDAVIHAGDQHVSTLTLVLLGRRKSGKSSAGNTIFGGRVFEAGEKTRQCVKRHGWVDGERLAVVDTPGWSSFGLANAMLVRQEIQRSVRLCLPRPQAFLLVIPVDAFSNRDRKAVEEYMSLLGCVWNHTVVLFTWADELRGKSIEDHMKKSGKHLQKILEKCGYRYHVLNNEKRNEHQVKQLLEIVK